MSDADNAVAAMSLFDGSQAGVEAAVSAVDSYYREALDPDSGEFLMQIVGILDDPFAPLKMGGLPLVLSILPSKRR